MKNFTVRNFLLSTLLILSTVFGVAQTTAVTATITDSDGQAWVNGSWSAGLYNPSGTQRPVYRKTGQPVPVSLSGGLNSSGAMSYAVPDNLQIDPAGTRWVFTFCSNTSATCSVMKNQTVTGSSEDFSSSFSSQVTAPRFSPIAGSYGYIDVEAMNPVKGSTYFNVISSEQRTYNGTTWVNSGMSYCDGSGNCTFNTVAAGPNVLASDGLLINTHPGQMNVAASTTGIAQGYILTNWQCPGSGNGCDEYGVSGEPSHFINYNLADDPGEGLHAGDIAWGIAPAGTAGAHISWARRMHLTAGGSLNVGIGLPYAGDPSGLLNSISVDNGGTNQGFEINDNGVNESLWKTDTSNNVDFRAVTGALGIGTIASTSLTLYTGGPANPRLVIDQNGYTNVLSAVSGAFKVGTQTVPSGGAATTVINGPAAGGGVEFVSNNSGGGLVYGSGPALYFDTFTGAIGSETYSQHAIIDASGFGVGSQSSSTGSNFYVDNSGDMNAKGSVQWGGGVAISSSTSVCQSNGSNCPMAYYSTTWTPAPTTVSSCTEQTVTVAGVVTTKEIGVNPPAFMGAHIWVGSVRASAANTVSVSFCADATGGTPPSGSWLFKQ